MIFEPYYAQLGKIKGSIFVFKLGEGNWGNTYQVIFKIPKFNLIIFLGGGVRYDFLNMFLS